MFHIIILVFAFLSANPAPMCSTSWARHMIATTILVSWSLATWAFSHLICNCPNLEGNWPFIMAFSCMPNISTFKTSSLPTLTNGSVPAKTRFSHDFATVWLRTPLQFFIFSHTHIFLDDLELIVDCFWTKPLDLLCFVYLRTFLIHAGQFYCASIFNSCLQMISVTIDAETMFAVQRKEVMF